jgi:hypothetical protein
VITPIRRAKRVSISKISSLYLLMRSQIDRWTDRERWPSEIDHDQIELLWLTANAS